jgi:transcription elongation factor Elf1
MSLVAYAISGSPIPMVMIPCPFCGQSTYTPDSLWIRREIETLGCGWCERSVKGEERYEAIGRINNEVF